MSRVVGAQRDSFKPGQWAGRLVALRKLRRLRGWTMPGTDQTPRSVLIADVVALPEDEAPSRIWRTQIVHSTGLIRAIAAQEAGVWVVGRVAWGDAGAWILIDPSADDLADAGEWLDEHAAEIPLEGVETRAEAVAEQTRSVLHRGRGGAS